MGSVWLAEDGKLDGRKVAIKMLPSVLVGKKGAYRQVKAEAMVAMKLSHPNIATVRAFEEDEGGNPFLVMDYIEGEGLDDILAEKGPLGEEETVRLLGPVAAALDYAHEKGVVHRDVKPGNVIVAKDGTPYVLDFGIAREIQETLTRVTGKLSSGTLLYMSPEQLKGKAPKAAQDVYSFAAMAYECLAGQPPFSRGQIEWQIVNEAPEELPEGVGEGLRAGVMAGLAKEPGERPGACAGVLGGETAKNGESRLADGEKSGGERKKERGGEDVFLRKVRVEKTLLAAEKRVDATAEEKESLRKVREVFSAGEEALKMGRDAKAGDLIEAAERSLAAWERGVEERKERERAEAGRRAREAEARWAREKSEEERRRLETEARRELERAEAARRRREEEIRREAERTEAERKRQEEEERAARESERRRVLAESRLVAGMTRTLTLPGGATLELVWCPAGSFTMGSPPDEPGRQEDECQHRVNLTKGFWLGKYPVTQRQWRSVTGGNPSYYLGGDLPVENVNWNDCLEFCAKAGHGLRLPTEAEWEYACRAGSRGAYGGTGRLNDMGWFGSVFLGRTHPVGEKRANAWGLHDMHGNVWEWCADWYAADISSAATDPRGAENGDWKVIRGGAWDSSAWYCRSARRPSLVPSVRVNNGGVRVCCGVEAVPEEDTPTCEEKAEPAPGDGDVGTQGRAEQGDFVVEKGWGMG
jgi:hypothetical protein